MSTTTTRSTSSRLDALEQSMARIEALLVAKFDADAPALAPVTPAKAEPKATPEFIVRRGANRAANKALAEKLRKADLPTNGPVWDAAKAGKSMRSLKALARKVA